MRSPGVLPARRPVPGGRVHPAPQLVLALVCAGYAVGSAVDWGSKGLALIMGDFGLSAAAGTASVSCLLYARSRRSRFRSACLLFALSSAMASLGNGGWGWYEVDPTNDCPADERHVVVAVGRDYSDVSPVRGVVRGGASELSVTVTMVAPSEHGPRRALPSLAPNPRDALTSVRAERARRRSHGDGVLSAGVAQSPATLAQAQQQQQQ